MSAFVVYGISRRQLLEKAKKSTKPYFTNERGKPIRQMRESEWEFAVGITAAHLHGKAKPVAISPRFDAPQFATQFRDMAQSDGTNERLCIMALTPTGQKDPKTKMPITEWRKWTGAIA